MRTSAGRSVGLRRQVQRQSLEVAQEDRRAASPLDEVIARETVERLTESEREVAALYLEAVQRGEALSQREVAEVVFPERSPEAGRREVGRTRARIEPLLDEALRRREK